MTFVFTVRCPAREPGRVTQTRVRATLSLTEPPWPPGKPLTPQAECWLLRREPKVSFKTWYNFRFYTFVDDSRSARSA